MKRVRLVLALFLVAGAFAFAYYRYVDAFTVRGGMPGRSGPPGMPAAAQRIMQQRAKEASKSGKPTSKSVKPSESTKSGKASSSGKSPSGPGEKASLPADGATKEGD